MATRKITRKVRVVEPDLTNPVYIHEWSVEDNTNYASINDFYLTYNNINYYFTKPNTIEIGDKFYFNIDTKVLKLNEDTISTSITGSSNNELIFVPSHKWSDGYINIGADARNVFCADGKTVEEKLGGLSGGYVEKTGDIMTGPLSTTELTIGSRVSERTVGTHSIAIGENVIATGNNSFAQGMSENDASAIITLSGAANTKVYTTNSTTQNIQIGNAITYNNKTAYIVSFVSGVSVTLDKTLSENSALDNVEVQIIRMLSATGEGSHAEGHANIASGDNSHAEGSITVASGFAAHSEGAWTIASGERSHAEGLQTVASALVTHAEGQGTNASGNYSHAEGYHSITSALYSHAEGNTTIASGGGSHAEGQSTEASGNNSHAEGSYTHATGYDSHTEGNSTTASGSDSHAEGGFTTALGYYSHAEGNYSHAEGEQSHAEGNYTVASGNSSHAEGQYTTAQGRSQHVEGEYNILDTASDMNLRGSFVHIVGNGAPNTRSNAHTLDWSGNAWFAGDVYTGSTSGKNKDAGSKKLATLNDTFKFTDRTGETLSKLLIDNNNVIRFSNDTTTGDICPPGLYLVTGWYMGTYGNMPYITPNPDLVLVTEDSLVSLFSNEGYAKGIYKRSPVEGTRFKVTSLSSSSTDTQYPSAKAVYTAIKNLPEPMVFKGSLGTGGTITALPVNGTANIGDTYKVITAGTYASQTAKIGDTFICLTKTTNTNTWELIPSGDEPSGTVTSITIKATSPIAIDSSNAITSSGTRTLSHANSGVTAGTYKSVTVNATGHVTAGTNPTTLSGYGITDAVAKTGDTMTGTLKLSSGDLKVITGTIHGEDNGTASYTNHAIKLGHAQQDYCNFYEYGGVFNFYKSMNGTDTLLGKITTDGWVGKALLSSGSTAITQPTTTNNTTIATTAFVKSVVPNISITNTDPGTGSALSNGNIILVYEA